MAGEWLLSTCLHCGESIRHRKVDGRFWTHTKTRVRTCRYPATYAEPIRLDGSGGGPPAQPVEEFAIRMSGGGMHVRNPHPDIERIYPRELWIKAEQRFGGKVYRRTVIVVEDWDEVPCE